MNISDNILKFNLRNVYFLIGTPCAGKTTLCKAISDKYGIPFFNSNHRDSDFKNWQELCHPDYQKVSAQRVTDWEAFSTVRRQNMSPGWTAWERNTLNMLLLS